MAEAGPAREQTLLNVGPASISIRQEEKHESATENVLTLRLKNRARQWLRTAAKEIGKSSLAW